MLVSVIICAYIMDRIKDLDDAMNSIFEQTYNDFKVTLVIDGDKMLYNIIKINLSI